MYLSTFYKCLLEKIENFYLAIYILNSIYLSFLWKYKSYIQNFSNAILGSQGHMYKSNYLRKNLWFIGHVSS
jgi:hypothetical protein